MTAGIDNPNELAPFSCSYTPNVPELLMKLNCSLAISTYQAGKVIFISPKNEDHLVQLPRTFQKPMGIAMLDEPDKMAVACKDEVIVFANSRELAFTYPKKKETYDALYMPRVTYHIGQLDIHDLSWGSSCLYAVNTLFSCIISIDDNFNFKPYWIPPFIKGLTSEDKCHLNGMVMAEGKPKYATAFNRGNSMQSWRDGVTTEGVLMDTVSGEIVLDNLRMPHSPRFFNNELYLLFSATGEIVKADLKRRSYEIITRINGFVRGMAHYKDFLFVGLSKLRQNSSTFAKLEIAKKASYAGIAIFHLPTGSFYGEIKYMASVDEIYDIQVLPGKVRPNIFNTIQPEYKLGLSIPGSTYWAEPKTTPIVNPGI
jgi:uncharacterized protein (TIGR03032 family)